MTRTRTLLLVFLVAVQLVLVGLSVYAYRMLPQGLIASDGKSYYAWLTSVLLDHDLDFTNDFALIYSPLPAPTAPITPRGLVANKTSVGVAMAELPGFLVGHGIAAASGSPRNGWSAPYQFSVTLWLQVVYLTALALLFVAMIRLGADPTLAAIGVASALVSTNLLQYVARPAMAHGPGLSVLCFTIYAAVCTRSPARQWRLVVLGLLIGFAVIIRTSNALVLPFLIPLILPHLGRSLARWLVLLAGVAVPIAIQVVFASAQWGRLTFSSYGDEGFTAGITGVVGTLFSARHGLFVYHPWYLLMLALTVFAALRRETRTLGVGALLTFCGFWLANGTWWSWWFGDGFGNRSFVETVPVLLIPSVLWLSAKARERGGKVLWLASASVCALTLANLMLWTGYVLRRFPPDGSHTVTQAWLWWR